MESSGVRRRQQLQQLHEQYGINDAGDDETTRGGDDDKVEHEIYSNGTLLACGITPPMLVLFAFGGRLALLSLCFGGIVTYILDVLGALEATLLSCILTLASIWISLVFASRNLGLNPLMSAVMSSIFATTMLYAFIIICGYFDNIRTAFPDTARLAEKSVFATISLISATILTWFLCLELPILDMSFCFSTVYFIYTYIMCYPRTSQLANNNLILDLHTVNIIYAIPILISLLVNLFVHMHVLSSSYTLLIAIIISICIPVLYIGICQQAHIQYQREALQTEVINNINKVRIIVIIVLSICLLSHPFFDDIKAYSGIEEPMSSLILFSVFLFASLGFYVNQNYVRQYLLQMKEDTTQSIHSKLARYLLYADIVENASIVLATMLLGTLLKIPSIAFIFCVICIRINFFFGRTSSTTRRYAKVLLLVGSAANAAIATLAFASDTLGYMEFNMSILGASLSMQDFCLACACIAAIAVLVPGLAPTASVSMQPLGYIPGVVRVVGSEALPSLLFDGFFTVFNISITIIEIYIRDQDWNKINISGELVYPSYILLSTSILLIVTSVYLLLQGSHSLSASWITILTQIVKLGQISGISCSTLITTATLISSYTLPYLQFTSLSSIHRVIRISKIPSQAIDMNNDYEHANSSSRIPIYLLFISSLVSTATSTLWAIYTGDVHHALDNLTNHDTTILKEYTSVLSIYFLFSALLVLMYYPLSPVRNILLLLSLVFAVISTGSFVEFSSNSSIQMVHIKENAATEHCGFFLLSCCALVALASSGILNIKNALTRIMFLISFTFCATMTLVGTAFPEPITDVEYHNFVTQTLPWITCSLLSILSTSTLLNVLANKKNAPSSTLTFMYSMLSFIPVLCSLISVIRGSRDVLGGVLTASIVVFFLLSIAVAYVTTKSKTYSSMICLFSSAQCIMWTTLLCTRQEYSDYADFLIPLSVLTLLTVPKNFLIKDTSRGAVVILVCSFVWIASAVYSICIKGYGNITNGFEFGQLSSSAFSDINVSFWNTNAIWKPILNIVLLCVPLPAIIIAFYRKHDESEDVIFIFSLFSAVSLFGGQIWSVRLLGVAGLGYGFWWCYELNARQQRSDQVI